MGCPARWVELCVVNCRHGLVLNGILVDALSCNAHFGADISSPYRLIIHRTAHRPWVPASSRSLKTSETPVYRGAQVTKSIGCGRCSHYDRWGTDTEEQCSRSLLFYECPPARTITRHRRLVCTALSTAFTRKTDDWHRIPGWL